MTSSNKTFRKSSRYTAFALFGAIASLAGVGCLLYLVNQLEQEYGALIRDRTSYERRLTEIRDEIGDEEERRKQIWNEREELRKAIAAGTLDLKGVQEEIGILTDRKAIIEAEIFGHEARLANVHERETAAQTIIDEAIRLRTQIVGLRNTKENIIREISDAENRQRSLDADLSALREHKAVLEDQTLAQQKNLADIKKEIETMQADREQVAVEIVGLSAEAERKVRLEQEIENIMKERDRVERENAAAQVALRNTQSALQDLQPQLSTIEAEVAAKKDELDDAKGEFANVRAQLDQLKTQLKANIRERNSAVTQRNAAQNDLERIENEIVAQMVQFDNLDVQILERSQKLAELNQERDLRAAEVARLWDQQTTLGPQVSQLKTEQKRLQQQVSGLTEIVDAARGELISVQSELTSAGQELAEIAGRRGRLLESIEDWEQREAQTREGTLQVETALQKLRVDYQQLQQQISDLAQSAIAAHGEYENVQDNVEKARRELTELMKAEKELLETITNLEKDEADARRAALKSEEELKRLQSELEQKRSTEELAN